MSTEDNCLRLSQDISDEFQKKLSERTILTLFDYNKAFDTVRRVSMLAEMKWEGLEFDYIKRKNGSLVNWTAQVRIYGEMSRTRKIKKGLPQETVLSHILLVLFIDNLMDFYEEGSFVSAFADELAIACSSRKKGEAVAMMQKEVSEV